MLSPYYKSPEIPSPQPKIPIKPTDIQSVMIHTSSIIGFICALIAKMFNPNIICYRLNNQDITQFFTNKNVLIFELRTYINDLEQLMKVAKNVIIIDNDKSCEYEMESISEKNKIYSQYHSLVDMTWNLFFPYKQMPTFLQYLSSWQLGKDTSNDYGAFCSWFSTISFTCKHCDELLRNDELVLQKIKLGRSLESRDQQYINLHLEASGVWFVSHKDKYYFVVSSSQKASAF